jgi:polyhydroxyalkanoate synthesis regulator phasin
MEVPAEFLQDVVAYVEKTNGILEKAASTEAEVANRAPAVVDALIKAGMLDADKRETAIDNVRDPLKTLESLRKTAEFMQKTASAAAKPAEMGSGAEMHKTAGSSESGKDTMKESDRIWMQHFGR